MYVSKPITYQCKIRWNRYFSNFRWGYFYLLLPYMASLSLFLWQWYVLVSIVTDNLLFQAVLVHRILNGHIILHLSFTRKVLPIFCSVMYIVHGLLLVFTLPYVPLQPPFVKGSRVPICRAHNLPDTAQQTVYVYAWGLQHTLSTQ
jgi:hypothetical protein